MGTTNNTDDLVRRFSFRPLTTTDLPMLHKWLTRPHWTEWWGEAPSLAEVEAEYGAWICNPAKVQPHIALLDDEPFGYIQSYVAMGSGGGWWEGETDPGVRGIDQSIADAAQLGRGFGTAMVKAFVANCSPTPASHTSRPTLTRETPAPSAAMKKPASAPLGRCRHQTERPC